MIERALVEYAANALWQVPLLAAGAWLLLAAIKAGPKVQHIVWLATLGLAVLLPMHGMGENAAFAVRAHDDVIPLKGQPIAQVPDPAAAARSHLRSGKTAWLPICSHRLEIPQVVERWMGGLYLGAVMFGLSRVTAAWRGARRLVQQSQEITLAGEQTVVLEDYGRRLKIRLPEVRESVEVSSPMVVGAMVPVLLLPKRFAAHGNEERNAALLHELAHVKRHDYLVNAICQVAAIPVAWHPVTYWVQGQVRRTREMACDRMAAEEMQSEIGYAKCLLTLAKSMLAGPEYEGQAAGVGLFSSYVLEERVMRLMEAKTAMGLRTKMVRMVSGATAMATATAMAVVFHVTPTLAASQAMQAQGMQASVAAPKTQTAGTPDPAAAASKASAPPSTAKAERCTGQRKIASATRSTTPKVVCPEVRKQIAQAQAEAAKARAFVNSPEFRKQIEEAQMQARKAQDMANSAAFREQMQQAQMTAAKVNLEMPRIQEQVRVVVAQVNSPEFRKQIEEAQKIDLSGVQRKVNEAICKQNDADKQDATDKSN